MTAGHAPFQAGSPQLLQILRSQLLPASQSEERSVKSTRMGKVEAGSAVWPHFLASGKLQSLGVQSHLALQKSVERSDAARAHKLQCAGVTGDTNGPPVGHPASLLSSTFGCNHGRCIAARGFIRDKTAGDSQRGSWIGPRSASGHERQNVSGLPGKLLT